MIRLFASDLHLDPDHPEITEQFLRFLAQEARTADSLYLLGDLFEAWLGDDQPEALGEQIAEALRETAASGVAVYVMQGNRDFLLGERFCRRAGALFLPDPVILDINSEPVLVTHGDALCTGDAAYQRLRALVRDPSVQRGLLALSAGQRRELAREARAGSRAHLAAADEYITDVDPQAVTAALRAAGASTLLHGHTHRPDVHHFEVDGRACTRIVLGAWHDAGSYLRWDEDGFALEVLPRA